MNMRRSPDPSKIGALKRVLCASLVAAGVSIGFAQTGRAQDVPPIPPATLFQNVYIFDGKSSELSAPSNVLIRGNTIERISADPIAVAADDNVRVIPADGRVLMPGFVNTHAHLARHLARGLSLRGPEAWRLRFLRA